MARWPIEEVESTPVFSPMSFVNLEAVATPDPDPWPTAKTFRERYLALPDPWDLDAVALTRIAHVVKGGVRYAFEHPLPPHTVTKVPESEVFVRDGVAVDITLDNGASRRVVVSRSQAEHLFSPNQPAQEAPMTIQTQRHKDARAKVFGAISKALSAKKKVTVIDTENDSVGPLGGVSSKLLLFVEVDGKQVPVTVNVYADSRIDANVTAEVRRRIAEREADEEQQGLYAVLLDDLGEA